MTVRRIWIAALLLMMLSGCTEERKQIVVPVSSAAIRSAQAQKAQMIEKLRQEFPKLKDNAAEALDSISRMLFVTDVARHRAYEDMALPIGSEQATLKPSDIGFLLSELDIQPNARILEIGTGTGYLAAVMSRLATEVYSVEIIEYLAEVARGMLSRLKIDNVHIRNQDGLQGWEKYAPFDVIVVTASVKQVPDALVEQLKPGGLIAVPLRDEDITQWKIARLENGELIEIANRTSNVTPAIE